MDKSEFYREARTDLTGPLAGMRVLEATTTWAGPMCACLLADFGADVIKVELPGGEVIRRMPPFLPGLEPPVSGGHATVNRNKRSLSLDLRTAEGQENFRTIAARSDIVVENFRPGTLASWGIGYEGIREVKPDIIYLSISGFGQFGPDHERAGYDPLAQAASGFLALNGEKDGKPVKAATALADDLTGLHGALATLAAVYYRQQTGEGQHVDACLLDSMIFQSNGFLSLGAMGVPTPRWGNEYPFAVPCNMFACKDGHVYLGVLLDAHWKTLVRLMDRGDLADDPNYVMLANRLQRRDEINALVAQWTADRMVADVVDLLVKGGLTAAPVRTPDQAAKDPHILARDMLQDTPQLDGSFAPIVGPAAKFSRTPTRVRSGAPALGAQNGEILQGIGLSSEEIEVLQEKKVIG
jgi:formyl-CoA transferase